jgi:hypothetical protein
MSGNEFVKESLSVDKTMYSLLEPDFLKEMAEILTLGAKKYSKDNWKKCKQKDIHLYVDALMRHFESYRQGNMRDEETNKHELAHCACNLMFLMYMEKLNEHK